MPFLLLPVAPPPVEGGATEVSDGRNPHLRSTQSVYLLSVRPSSHSSVRPSQSVNQSFFLPDAFNPTASSGAAVQTKQNLFLLFLFVAVFFFSSRLIMEHSENMVFKSLGAAAAASGECVPRCVGGAEWRPQGG